MELQRWRWLFQAPLSNIHINLWHSWNSSCHFREKTDLTVVSEDLLIWGFISSCSVPLHVESLSLLICTQHHSSWQTLSLLPRMKARVPQTSEEWDRNTGTSLATVSLLPENWKASWWVTKLLLHFQKQPLPPANTKLRYKKLNQVLHMPYGVTEALI